MRYGKILKRADYILDDDGNELKGDALLKAEQKMATEAMEAETDSFESALTRVKGMKEDYGKGISAMVMIYNGSDNPVTLREYKGRHHAKPHQNDPDDRIEPGEWSVHLWEKGTMLHGVVACIAYNVLGHTEDFVWKMLLNAGMGTPVQLVTEVIRTKQYNAQSWDDLFKEAVSDEDRRRMTRDTGYIRVHAEASQGTSPLMKFYITRSDIGRFDG
ncbi:MAG: hypothetical protein AAGH17_02510 [Pseudomonadota bacterium]